VATSTRSEFRRSSLRSDFAVFQALDEPREHAGNLLERRLQRGMLIFRNQLSAAGHLKQRNALLRRATRVSEGVAPVGLGEATVAFADVGRDGEGCAIQLIDEEAVTGLEVLSTGADLVR
jgi:hypothetical protein